MSHTPGPWTTCNKAKCPCMFVGSADHPICRVESGPWGDEYATVRVVGSNLERRVEAYMDRIEYGLIDPETARANAILIAAAPDLLTVVREAVRLYEDYGLVAGRIEGEPMAAGKWIDSARKVIRKAVTG